MSAQVIVLADRRPAPRPAPPPVNPCAETAAFWLAWASIGAQMTAEALQALSAMLSPPR